MIALTHDYGLSHEPFSSDIPVVELFTLPGLIFPVLVGSAALALAIAAATMFLSSFFLRVLGKTGVSVIERIMGIVLDTSLSVQFVYDGLVKLHVVAGS